MHLVVDRVALAEEYLPQPAFILHSFDLQVMGIDTR